MPDSLTSLFLTYGPLGIMVLLLLIPMPGKKITVLVPWYYVQKVQEETELLRQAAQSDKEAAAKVINELQIANRIIGELRAIAESRGGNHGKDP